jgi:ribosomal-protein-serine acetyltransferase
MSEIDIHGLPTQCRTGAILIRRYRLQDAPALMDAVRESIATVGRWQDWCRAGYGGRQAGEWIEHAMAAWNSTHSYEFGIFDAHSGGYLGGIGVNQRNREHNFANIGYWVRESCQGRGVATAATRVACDFAFDSLDLTRIEIIAAVDNLPSRRVAEKAGARFEGFARNRLVLNGAAIDAAVYAMISGDRHSV